jgi:hypothetical protein
MSKINIAGARVACCECSGDVELESIALMAAAAATPEGL